MHNYRPMFRIWLGPYLPIVIIVDPIVAKEVLGSGGPSKKSSLYRFLHPWLHTG